MDLLEHTALPNAASSWTKSDKSYYCTYKGECDENLNEFVFDF
jgi:hypothetical protein